MEIEQERDQSNKKLDFVFGVIQKPSSRGKNFIIGWDTDGNPSMHVVSEERDAISQRGLVTRGRNQIIDFPYDAETSRLTPKVFEFLEMSKPVDNRDTGSQFTEDVVNIACANGIGATSFLAVKELTLLTAIMEGEISWTIGGVPSYSLIIPDADTNTLNFVLFSPGDHPSNDFAYRNFLLRVIKVLASIDRNQVPPDQKGYMNVVEGVVEILEAKAEGEKLKTNVLEKIQAELGLLDEIRGVGLLRTLPVDKLRIVVQNFKTVAEESFEAGR